MSIPEIFAQSGEETFRKLETEVLAERGKRSGIILSTATKEKSVIAEVIAAGPGTDDVKVTVKKGDKVVTGKYAGQELKLDGEDYVIVKMADILAVVE